MKQIYMTILLFIGADSFSQNAQLFDNTWYLSRMTIEGVDLYPPVNPEVPFVPLNFTVGDVPTMLTNVCNSFGGNVNFAVNETDFSIFQIYTTLLICNASENTTFEVIYGKFWGSINFSYSIVELGDIKTLYVTSGNRQAVYSDVQLAQRDFSKTDFALYPNPADTFVNLQLEGFVDAGSEAEIFDALGKTLIKVPMVSAYTKIMTEGLPTGIYYVKIKNGSKTVTKKLSKL